MRNLCNEQRAIEAKIQEKWLNSKEFEVEVSDAKKYSISTAIYIQGQTQNFYTLALADIDARYRRLRKYNVLFSVGYTLPRVGQRSTEEIVQKVAETETQMRSLGLSCDFRRNHVIGKVRKHLLNNM
jgi:leucyl-tRNA synthetase